MAIQKSSLLQFPFFADLVVIARSLYPIPSRTRPSKSSAPMVLSLKAWKSRSLPGLQRTETSSSTIFRTKPRGKPRGFLFAASGCIVRSRGESAVVRRQKRIAVNSSVPQSSVVYATTDDGLRLPVIDVTRPEFALPDDPHSVAALDATVRVEERRNALVPGFVMRLMIRAAARRSRLLADIVHPDTSFLAGLTTYIMKLGVENLPPPFDSDVDRRVVGSPQTTAVRLRLQQTVKLLAQALEPHLAAAPSAPLVLINIGGGPAIDSLNALIVLNGLERGLLQRPIAVDVLDIDSAGPHFGAAALTALSGPGQPLAGLDITFTHRHYDWNVPARLGDLVRESASRGALIAASSEGALFEYGDDEAVVTNLQALHNAGNGAKLVVGSVTSADALHRQAMAGSRFKLMPRGLDGFRPLAERGGFHIARSAATPLGDQVLLCPI
jgi:hypothetical protein